MGYPSTAEGMIDIDPPLTAAELRAHPQLTTAPSNVGGIATRRYDRQRDAAILIRKQRDFTEDGEIVKLSGPQIVAGGGEGGEGYSRANIGEHLDEIAAAFPDRKFTGRIVLTYEDGEQEAYIIHEGRAKVLRPIVTWPDESEAVLAVE